MRMCDLRLQKSGGARTVRVYYSDDEFRVTYSAVRTLSLA